MKLLRDRTKFWPLQLQLSRQDVPRYCEGLADLMSDIGHETRYIPRHGPDRSLWYCAWEVPFAGKARGLRWQIWLLIGPTEVEKAELHLSLGQDMQEMDAIDISEVERESLRQDADRILVRAAELAAGNAPVHFVLSYLRGLFYVSCQCENNGPCLYPTRLFNGQLVTPVVVPTHSVSDSWARSQAEKKLLPFFALVQLLSMNIVEPLQTEQLAMSQGLVSDEPYSVDRVDSILGSSVPLNDETRKQMLDLSAMADALLELVASGNLLRDDKLHRALFAHMDGVGAANTSVPLAGVAFMASLSAFTATETCPGEVSCSVCGERPKHPTVGEVKRIVSVLDQNIFDGADWQREEAEKQLLSFYRNQRSAFVHAAKRVVAKTARHENWGTVIPDVSKQVPPEQLLLEQFNTLRALADLALLREVSQINKRLEEVFIKRRDAFRICKIPYMMVFRTTDTWSRVELQPRIPSGFM